MARDAQRALGADIRGLIVQDRPVPNTFDLARAEQEFQAELANDPSYQLAIAELGEVRYHQQRWGEAAEQLAKSRTTTPELLYMLCDAYFHLGRVNDARLNAEVLAAYARNKPDVIEGLIDLLRQNGQSDLAGRLQF